jgi:hypothetical protein
MPSGATRSRKMLFSIPRDLELWLRSAAQRRGVPMSRLVRDALRVQQAREAQSLISTDFADLR